MTPSPLTVSTPGRICLFGEHQDYLGLPVIAAAISRRIRMTGTLRPDRRVVIQLPDINARETFELAPTLAYEKPRDYFRSVVNILQREGVAIDHGVEVTVRGDIPINSGTSSSSALLVTWIHFLLRCFDGTLAQSPEAIGDMTYRAEVLEFGEPGGMMDHYSTALGNVMYFESQPTIHIEKFRPSLGTFVLGDSLEPKDTIGILRRVKYGMLEALRKIQAYDPTFDLHHAPQESAAAYRTILTADELQLLQSNLSDRDILRDAKQLLENETLSDERRGLHLGALLNQHQDNLRDAKRISTPKIDAMLDAALRAGAVGGKINGSGGGGCMFAYAPDQPEVVAEAVERAGGKAYIVTVDEGTRVESPTETFAVK
ncbi:mevalonate kinase [Catalinimonas alkaloidigena]|nr:galactokinase family protein [Catalinimonas alkaloidigena]